MIPSPVLQKCALELFWHTFETFQVFDALHRKKQVMG